MATAHVFCFRLRILIRHHSLVFASDAKNRGKQRSSMTEGLFPLGNALDTSLRKKIKRFHIIMIAVRWFPLNIKLLFSRLSLRLRCQ